jgi:hypothetical protein
MEMQMRFLFILLSMGFLALHVAPAEAKGVKLTPEQVKTVCGKDIQSGGGNTGCTKNCGLNGQNICDYNCKGGKCEGQIVAMTTGDDPPPAPWTGLPFADFRQISASPNMGSLADTCQKVGGAFMMDGAGVYSCQNANCDKKGGACEIRCDTDTRACYGLMPQGFGEVVSLLGILQNGNDVYHASESQGAGQSLSSSGGAAAAAPAAQAPAPSVPIIY